MNTHGKHVDTALFKRLTLPFADMKLDSAGSGSFSGYASTFGNVDLGNDIVEQGAFASSIPGFLAAGFIAWGHDWDGEPVAYPTVAQEDERGLYIEAGFHSTPKAQSARQIVAERLAAGKFMGLSIGYKVAPGGAAMDEATGARRIHEISWLPETSIVMAPMNPRAGVLGVKAADWLRHRLVDELGLTPDQIDALTLDERLGAKDLSTETYADELERLLLRTGEIRTLRAKAGRPISAARRRRLIALRDELDALLAETEPKRDEDDEEEDDGKSAASGDAASVDVAALHARFLAFEFRQFEYEHARMGRE